MLIAIDESGTFVPAQQTGSWCAVAAYVFAERQKTATLRALSVLKRKYGCPERMEVKLRQVEEADYFKFLDNLRKAGGALFAVATDSGLATMSEISAHRALQVESIRSNVPRMRFEEGKAAVSALADSLEGLSGQLYVQLVCQVSLLSVVLRRGILYFVQRDPFTLRRFVWRIDQKNATRTAFESAFERIAPAMLQSESFRNPAIFLEGADYSHFGRFEFSADEYPKYLQEEYGHIPQSAVNIGKILRENMQFPDSKFDLSVQVADLLAAGLRRCLRGEFCDNVTAAARLGSLMIQDEKRKPPISLIRLSGRTARLSSSAAEATVLRMRAHARRMLHSA